MVHVQKDARRDDAKDLEVTQAAFRRTDRAVDGAADDQCEMSRHDARVVVVELAAQPGVPRVQHGEGVRVQLRTERSRDVERRRARVLVELVDTANSRRGVAGGVARERLEPCSEPDSVEDDGRRRGGAGDVTARVEVERRLEYRVDRVERELHFKCLGM